MPKHKTKPAPRPTRTPTRWLVAAAAVAVLLAAGLYGARTGWFGGTDEDEPTPPRLGQAPPERPAASHENAVARSAWGAPAGAPVVGVGAAVSADAPEAATLVIADGRADVGIRVPPVKADGQPCDGYSLELRAGTQRLWGSYIPAEKTGARGEAIGLSLNANELHAIGVDDKPITVVVGGTARFRSDTLGTVRLALRQAP